jgi:GNAT superfamily N-acetyltransferase
MMHTTMNNKRLAELAFAQNGQTRFPHDETYWLLPSLRPLLGLLPSCRGYDIRPVLTPFQHDAANMLVQQMHPCRCDNGEPHRQWIDDPNRVTLAARQYDELAATLTLDRDNPEGLLADALYAPELARLRHPERIVCEVSRLAVDPDFSSRDLLIALFQAAFKYARNVFAASDAVIEVNPRHSRYYQRLLGFRQIGRRRQCRRLDAPVVLLHQELDDMTDLRS